MIVSPISGRMVGRYGPRPSLVISGTALALACATLTDIGPETSLARLLASYVLFGLGFGLVNAPITNTAVSGMPRAQAGVAAAIASTSRQFGQAIGVAITGAIVASHAGASTSLSSAGQAGWWTLTGLGVVVLVLGLVATSGRATASARHTAQALNPEALAA